MKSKQLDLQKRQDPASGLALIDLAA